jgi:hypothetical protein
VEVSSSAGPVEIGVLSDEDFESGIRLPKDEKTGAPWIELSYREPVTVQSITLAESRRDGSASWTKELQASEDGEHFREVVEVPPASFLQQTFSFAPVTARYFRLIAHPRQVVDPWWSYREDNAAAGAWTTFPPWGPSETATEHPYALTELILHSTAHVHRFEEKAGFALVPDYYAIASPPAPNALTVKRADVIDLTKKMAPDGSLHWTPPPGNWVVLRLGYSLTGKRNQPAPTGGAGLEVDKLNREHVATYIDRYLDLLGKAVGANRIGPHGIRSLQQDSIESGAMNWTEHMRADFRRLRGYDPTPWLPVLTGVQIESAAASDKFLWDFRRTIAQLLVESNYGQLATTAHARGMTVYAEATEDRRVHSLGDDMEMRRYADVPMGAMWTFEPQHQPWPSYVADIRGAASVGHVYGHNIIAAESFTSILNPWAFAPRDLKPIADLMFALGINGPIIHTSVHQPLDDRKPGLSLWIACQFFTRHDTWAEQAKPWIDYLSRSAFLLQQGRYVADVAYFYGEEAPLTGLYAERPLGDTPTRYGFDFVNADVVLNLLQVRNGDLITPSGMRYKLLYLGGTSRYMTLPVLRRIAQLVEAGATVVGARPSNSPSLGDDPIEFDRLAARLWQSGRVGKGRVISGRSVEDVLQSLAVAPDFDYTAARPDSEVLFLHRKLQDGEIYFISNRKARPEQIEASLRVTGYRPEIWRAASGRSEPVSYRIENGRTLVRLDMAANDAFFLVFRERSTQVAQTVSKGKTTTLGTLDGPWTVTFQGGRGAPGEARFDHLVSFTERTEPGIRYFSGTASYRKRFEIPAAATRGGTLWLDLGAVGDLAEVLVNGRSVGVSWMPPHRIDITAAAKPGRNELEIRVTNLWVNRLIGDAQPGARPITFTTVRTYKPDAPLRPAGLMGPVVLSSQRQDDVAPH